MIWILFVVGVIAALLGIYHFDQQTDYRVKNRGLVLSIAGLIVMVVAAHFGGAL